MPPFANAITRLVGLGSLLDQQKQEENERRLRAYLNSPEGVYSGFAYEPMCPFGHCWADRFHVSPRQARDHQATRHRKEVPEHPIFSDVAWITTPAGSFYWDGKRLWSVSDEGVQRRVTFDSSGESSRDFNPQVTREVVRRRTGTRSWAELEAKGRQWTRPWFRGRPRWTTSPASSDDYGQESEDTTEDSMTEHEEGEEEEDYEDDDEDTFDDEDDDGNTYYDATDSSVAQDADNDYYVWDEYVWDGEGEEDRSGNSWTRRRPRAL